MEKEKLHKILIESSADKLVEIVNDRGKITLGEVANILGVDEERALDWAKTLDSHNLIDIDYGIQKIELKEREINEEDTSKYREEKKDIEEKMGEIEGKKDTTKKDVERTKNNVGDYHKILNSKLQRAESYINKLEKLEEEKENLMESFDDLEEEEENVEGKSEKIGEEEKKLEKNFKNTMEEFKEMKRNLERELEKTQESKKDIEEMEGQIKNLEKSSSVIKKEISLIEGKLSKFGPSIWDKINNLRKSSKGEKESKENYVCEICGKDFGSERGLKIHKGKMHKG